LKDSFSLHAMLAVLWFRCGHGKPQSERTGTGMAWHSSDCHGVICELTKKLLRANAESFECIFFLVEGS
jgi:hypothetical protein